jgi:hypothetical protein
MNLRIPSRPSFHSLGAERISGEKRCGCFVRALQLGALGAESPSRVPNGGFQKAQFQEKEGLLRSFNLRPGRTSLARETL